jgi:exopolysaccharide production protein ExoY
VREEIVARNLHLPNCPISILGNNHGMSLRQVRDLNVHDEGARRSRANTDDLRAESDERIRVIDDPGLAVASRRLNGRGKRAFDLVIGGAGFIFVLPFIVTMIVVLRLDGGGPAISRTRMIGRRGRPFAQLRFRARRRRRRMGEWDRTFVASGLARLPSLINVIIGDLSLVGPTPVDRDGLAQYGADRRYYLVARPGLTAPWRREDVRAANLPSLCRDYVFNWRIRRDLAVLRAALFDSPRPRPP